MLKKIKQQQKTVLAIGLISIISGCMLRPTIFQPYAPRDINNKFSSGFFTQKSDNLYIIVDTSTSMNKPYLSGGYQGEPLPRETPSRIEVSKEILKRLSITIPDIELKTAVRSFGYGGCSGWEKTTLVQDLQAFNLKKLTTSINKIPCASGGSPLDIALEKASEDLLDLPDDESITLLVLSDGEHISSEINNLALQLKSTKGDGFCLDTIWLGEEGTDSHSTLTSLSKSSSCGQSFEAKNISSPKGMAIFVRKTLMTAVDLDNDGTPDFLDQCPQADVSDFIDLNNCDGDESSPGKEFIGMPF